jgi:hypothetical protein
MKMNGRTCRPSQSGWVHVWNRVIQVMQWDHDHRRQYVAECERQAEHHLEGERHDGRFDREKNEGETRIDQRGDG